jgi:fumarate hydratase class II
MLITALSPVLGYDTCAKIAHKAYLENKSLKDAAVEMGVITPEDFDKKVKPESML